MYRVLLVEDEDIIRKGILFSVDWASAGCIVVAEAKNGQEGLEVIARENPDIVIADINMPLMDGLNMIRNSYESYDYSAILLSGYSEFDYAREAMKYGVTGYLLKPLNVEELKEALERAKEERRIKEAYSLRLNSKEQWRNASVLKEYSGKDIEDPVVEKMLSYIHENYQEKVTFADVVTALNYSERFLNRKFKEALGTTFSDYLNRYRIQKAIELIKEGGLRMQEVAWRCGIGDYKYFKNVFSKYMGCSPKEYRAEIE